MHISSLMERSSQSQNKVLTESNFHKQLQSATASNDKMSFNLALAMMTKRANLFDEFHVPKSPEYHNRSDLKKTLHVHERPLQGVYQPAKSIEQNKLVHQNQLTELKLQLALQPEPIARSESEIPQAVLNSLDANVYEELMTVSSQNVNDETMQQRLEQQKVEQQKKEALAEHKAIDFDAWFNVLQQARAV